MTDCENFNYQRRLNAPRLNAPRRLSACMPTPLRAIERDQTAGLIKLVVDASNDMILGASILAPEGGALVQILSTLMLAKQPYTLLKGAIYIHPTLAEGFFGLMESVKAE